MSGFLLLIAGLGALALGAYFFTQANPSVFATRIRYLGAGSLFLLAIYLSFRGSIVAATPLFALSAWLIRRSGFTLTGMGSRSSGQRSEVRSEWLHMTLDHDTGTMDGAVTGGRFAGRRLAELSSDELAELRDTCLVDDPEGVRLLDAYLDRMDASEGGDTQGRGFSADSRRKTRQTSDMPMTKEQAYEILGVEPGCTQEDIRQAHRGLMLKLHPDQGGSDYLAAQINRAKELLL